MKNRDQKPPITDEEKELLDVLVERLEKVLHNRSANHHGFHTLEQVARRAGGWKAASDAGLGYEILSFFIYVASEGNVTSGDPDINPAYTDGRKLATLVEACALTGATVTV